MRGLIHKLTSNALLCGLLRLRDEAQLAFGTLFHLLQSFSTFIYVDILVVETSRFALLEKSHIVLSLFVINQSLQ
jgi:hypothetical protein